MQTPHFVVAGAARAPRLPLLAPTSSRSEAPNTTNSEKIDVDFYMFRSDEAGCAGFVRSIADHIPLKATYGSPTPRRSTRPDSTRLARAGACFSPGSPREN